MFYIFSKKTFAKTDGANVVLINGQDQTSGFSGTQAPPADGRIYTSHMLSIDPGDNTTGTITVTATTTGRTTAEPVYESDGTTPLVIDLANSPRSFPVGGSDATTSLVSVTLTNATLNGTTTVTATVASGD